MPAQAFFRAVLVLLRLFAFPFKPGAKPVRLSDVHLHYVPFQYLESKLLSNYLWSFRGSCVRHEAALPYASLETLSGELCLGVYIEEFGISVCTCIGVSTYICFTPV